MKLSTITAAIQAAVKLKPSPAPFENYWIFPFKDSVRVALGLAFDPKTGDAKIINIRTLKVDTNIRTGFHDRLCPSDGNNWLKQNKALADKLKKADSASDTLISDVVKSLNSTVADFMSVATGRITVPANLATAVPKVVEPPAFRDPNIPDAAHDGYFVLGYWLNAYGDGKEYFWSGPFRDKANATKAGKRRQDNGQPKSFRDWSKGSNRIIQGWDKFKTAANKVDVKPSTADLEYQD